jgi:cellobiose phosphorylase
MYSYLTGSASWFILTYLTQVFGVKGEYGDLVIEPGITAEQFKGKNIIGVTSNFADKLIEVKFINQAEKNPGGYLINKVVFNGKIIAENLKTKRFHLSRSKFLALSAENNTIEITLTGTLL